MFKILSYAQARSACLHFPKILNVISISSDLFHSIPEDFCKNRLFLRFDDVRKKTSKGVFPTKEDILKAIDFSKKHEINIIHCKEGISRSAGIAYAILRNKGYSKDQAQEEIIRINYKCYPNPILVELTDSIFK